LLMLAGRDRISDNPRLRSFFEQLRSDAKQLIEYPNAAHTLEFETDTREYFGDLIGWAERQGTSVTSSIRARRPR